MTCFKIFAAAAISFLATGTIACAETPTCGAAIPVDILRNQAKEGLSNPKPTGVAGLDQLNQAALKIYFPNGGFDIQVDQMFAVSRSEDVRECQAMMHLVQPGRVSGDSPVFYSVTRSEDGHDLLAINGDQVLFHNLLQSLEANNSDLRDSLNAFRRELFSSGNRGIGNVMRANPNSDKPAQSFPGSSSFGRTGNGGAPSRGVEDGE